MKRTLALVIATLAGLFLAAKGQSEVIGTVVSTDPVANTIVVRGPDGTQSVYRTVETTKIQQGGSVVQLRTLQPGTQVEIMADPTPPPATTGTVVYPVASGIVVTPGTTVPVPSAAPPPPPPPKASHDSESKSEREVKIKEKHEEDDDD
jgi:hypothetical protein